MSKNAELTGTVEDVFGHRFTLATDQGKTLIDLGPGSGHEASLAADLEVAIKGDEKPGEIKAREIRIGDGEWQSLKNDHGSAPKPSHGKPDDTDGNAPTHDLDDDHVTWMLDAAGYTDHGERERKPKHVEVMASKDGQRHKVHVHQDGVRKAEPVA